MTEVNIDRSQLEDVLVLFDNLKPVENTGGDVEELIDLAWDFEEGGSTRVVVKWSIEKVPLRAEINGKLYGREINHWKMNNDAGAVFIRLGELAKLKPQDDKRTGR